MKKQFLVLIMVAIVAMGYSQEKKQSNYFIGISGSGSGFTNSKIDFYDPSGSFNLQIERLDSVKAKSIILRMQSDFYERNTLGYNSISFTSLETIGRFYSSRKSLFKVYGQIGVLYSVSSENVHIGIKAGGGLHVGKFRKFNGVIEVNHAWNTGKISFLQFQAGISFPLESFFE